MTPAWLQTKTDGSLRLACKIIPNAKNTCIQTVENNELRIRLKTLPIEGRANKELIKIIAKQLKLSKQQVQIKRGTNNRHKTLSVTGIDARTLCQRLKLES